MIPEGKKPAVLESTGTPPTAVGAPRLFAGASSSSPASGSHALGSSFDTHPPAPASGPQPVSPRAVAPRLMKVLKADEHSQVDPTLGPKSGSHPGVPFDEGGGFISRRKVERPLSVAEVAADHQRRVQSWKDHGERGREPQPKPNARRVEMSGDLEYHPPGGIHSDYDPKVSDVKGGSYLRVKTSAPAHVEGRFGRHGPFANTETFERKPLDPAARHRRGPAEKAPPPVSGSPPPSPRTAGILTDRLYGDPEALMAALASGRPYKELAGTDGGGGPAAAAAAMSPGLSSSSAAGPPPALSPPSTGASPPGAASSSSATAGKKTDGID